MWGLTGTPINSCNGSFLLFVTCKSLYFVLRLSSRFIKRSIFIGYRCILTLYFSMVEWLKIRNFKIYNRDHSYFFCNHFDNHFVQNNYGKFKKIKIEVYSQKWIKKYKFKTLVKKKRLFLVSNAICNKEKLSIDKYNRWFGKQSTTYRLN